jgi:ABC-2 type transport system permease protein
MTASTITSPAPGIGRVPAGRLIGLAPMVRKDLAEWTHGKRMWVILAITALFMALAAANGAIAAWVLANVPDGANAGTPLSMDPLDNFMAAIGSQFFVLVAVFAAMGLLVAEREHGTLAWVASKPVSRGAIWVSKWSSASAVISIVAGIVPVVVVFGLVAALYGAAPIGVLVAASAGIVASIVLVVAVVLAASTVVSNQAAAAAIGVGVYFLPTTLAGLIPFDIEPVLPTSILGWAIATAMGADAGFVTPIAWIAFVAAIAAFASWRMGKIEL